MAEGSDFDSAFVALFESEFPRLFRYLDRIGGDPDLASDLAQEAFVRLYRRGAMPDAERSWLVTVAMNLFRNHRNMGSRRRRLLTVQRAERAHSDRAAAPSVAVEAHECAARVRAALDGLRERDRLLLLLNAEGFSYEEMSEILDVAKGSVGTLLARARRAFERAMNDG